MSDKTLFNELKTRLRGNVILKGDAEYDAEKPGNG